MARVAIAFVEVRPDLGGFAEKLHAELAKINAVKEVELKVDTKQLNDTITRVARRKAPPIKQKIEPEVDNRVWLKGATDAMKEFSQIFGSGTIGRVINLSIGAAAGIVENFSEVGVKAFSALGQAVFDAAGHFGRFSTAVEKVGLFMVDIGAGIVGVISGFGGLAAAVGLAGIALAAINVVLGALLAVIIPLVGGVTALVAQLVALGAVGVGAFALLPGALVAVAAAFGPLTLVMQKFQDLFQKNVRGIGSLYVVFERLKNAIFAVISIGLVEQFTKLATTVLPKLLASLLPMLGAWNRLITLALKLAATPAVINTINVALRVATYFLNLFSNTLAKVGPQLLTLVTTAAPALRIIGSGLATVIGQLGTMISALGATGQMSAFFQQIAVIVAKLLTLLPPLVTLMMSWIGPILPAAQQMVTLLGQMVAHWVQMASTADFGSLILNFFLSMNRIIVAFQPLLDTVVTSLLQFGPTLASLTEAALPALTQLVSIFSSLLTNMAPGIIVFLNQFSAMISNPAVMAAFTQLGQAIGVLVASFGQMKPETMAGILNVFSSLIRLTSKLVETVWPLTDAMVALIDTALKILEPILTGLQDSITKFASATDVAMRALSGFMEKLKNITGPIGGALSWLNKFTGGQKSAGDEIEVLAKKTKDNTYKISQYFDAMGKAAGIVVQDAAGNLTRFANADAWQVIMDNADAAAKAIAHVGQTAFDISQLQGEKALGKLRQQQKQFAKKAKPPSTKGLSDAWNAGWNQAIDTSTGKAKTAAKKVGNAFVTNLKPTLSQLNLMDLIKGGRAYDTGIEIARYLAKGITSGTKNINKATAVIYKANKKSLDAFAGKLKDFATKSKTYADALGSEWPAAFKKMTSVSQLDAFLKDRKAYWTDLLNQIVDFKNNVKDALIPDKGLVGVFGYFPTPAEVKQRFDDELARMRKFTQGIVALQAKGLDPELARQWLQAGIAGAGNMVEGLQNATDAQIKDISTAYQAINTEAESVAEQQAVAWKGVGEATVQGYIDGINSMETLVVTTMTKMMKDALAGAKKALGIKSPSRVFDDIGVQTMAGYIQGIDSMVNATVGTVAGVYDTVAGVPPSSLTPQIAPSLANTGTLGQVAAQAAPEVNVRVYIGDKELTDIARVVVENADSTRARALLAGRRGG